jgi:hypothetical protein
MAFDCDRQLDPLPAGDNAHPCVPGASSPPRIHRLYPAQPSKSPVLRVATLAAQARVMAASWQSN